MLEKKGKRDNHSNSLNVNETRRKLIHSAWVTPAITSVILPAHAQTSSSCNLLGERIRFDSSGSYTIPSNVNCITLEVCGAGGGGGGGGGAGRFDISGAGGRGASGQSITQTFDVSPGSTINFTIGQGGLGGAGGSATRIGSVTTPMLTAGVPAGGGEAGGDSVATGPGVSLMAPGGAGGGGGGNASGGIIDSQGILIETTITAQDGVDGDSGGAGGAGKVVALQDEDFTNPAVDNGENGALGFSGNGTVNGGIGGSANIRPDSVEERGGMPGDDGQLGYVIFS